MKEKLPIGTVLMLKDADQLIMIIGYNVYDKTDDNKIIYDYSACLYPLGIFDLNNTIAFNNSDIDKVIYVGYKYEKYDEFVKALENVDVKTDH